MDADRQTLQESWLSLEEAVVPAIEAINQFSKATTAFVIAKRISPAHYLRQLADLVETGDKLRAQMNKLGVDLSIKPANHKA